jgi:hypothetical protein
MVGDNGPGVYRQIQDEVFLSRQCRRDTQGNSLYPNPHDGRMEGERFCYHYPATWYYSHAVNKVIGLRRLQIIPRWYNLRIHLDIKDTTALNDTYPVEFVITISPEMNLGEALSILCRYINKGIHSYRPDTLRVIPYYNAKTNTASLKFVATNGHHERDYQITLAEETDGDLDDFFDMMNVPVANRQDYFASPPNLTYTFPNVWSRIPQNLYFHASFVNHTQFNYLGQEGDFYPKPSKIYTADNLPAEFYFWISADGFTPIVLQFEDFLIELAFIIDSQDYQSP